MDEIEKFSSDFPHYNYKVMFKDGTDRIFDYVYKLRRENGSVVLSCNKTITKKITDGHMVDIEEMKYPLDDVRSVSVLSSLTRRPIAEMQLSDVAEGEEEG